MIATAAISSPPSSLLPYFGPGRAGQVMPKLDLSRLIAQITPTTGALAGAYGVGDAGDEIALSTWGREMIERTRNLSQSALDLEARVKALTSGAPQPGAGGWGMVAIVIGSGAALLAGVALINSRKHGR